jgi:hypothetical protein
MDALRRRYRNLLWDAEYLDSLGATVSRSGKAHSLYSVFIERTSGRRAVVLANESFSDSVSLNVDLPNKTGLSIIRPESPEPETFEAELTLEPESAAVVMEIGWERVPCGDAKRGRREQ